MRLPAGSGSTVAARFAAAVLASLMVVACPSWVEASGENPIPRIVSLYLEGVAAGAEGDLAAYETAMRDALTLAPGHPALARHLARALAGQGKRDEALARLAGAAACGVDLGIEADSTFLPLHGDPRFDDVVARLGAGRAAVGAPEEAFVVPERGLMAEGIAWEAATGAIFVGSVLERSIWRVDPDGNASRFADDEAFLAVLGLRVDPPRGLLWVCSAAFPGMNGWSEEMAGSAALHAVDLADGRVVRTWRKDRRGEAEHNFNDVAVTTAGDVFITDAGTGAIYRLASPEDTLETFLPDGSILGANGIDATPDGDALLVSAYSLGIARVDAATRSVSLLAHPDTVATVGVDGLYVRGSALLVVQNYPGLDRVAELRLDETGTAVTGLRVLVAHSPLHDEPTTAAVLPDAVLYIGNSQLNKLGPRGEHPPKEDLEPTRILRVGL